MLYICYIIKQQTTMKTKSQAIRQAKQDYSNEYGKRPYDCDISVIEGNGGKYLLLIAGAKNNRQSIEVRL